MRLILDIPPNGIEADVKAFDDKGNPMPVPARLSIDPYFFGTDPVARVMHGRIELTSVQRTTQKMVVVINGRTGKARVLDRTQPTTAAIEATAAAEAVTPTPKK